MIRDSRRKAKRVRRALERKAAVEARITAARARVLPEPTTRTSTRTSTMCHQPFEATINEYRQTPESWRDVWADIRDGTT